jgi:hypothetical protein
LSPAGPWVILVGDLGGSVSVVQGEDRIRLTDEERLDWLRLIRCENVGPRGIMAQTPQEVKPDRP